MTNTTESASASAHPSPSSTADAAAAAAAAAPHIAVSSASPPISSATDANQAEKQHSPDAISDNADKAKRSTLARHWKPFARRVGLDPLPSYVAWVGPCLTWPKLKPVIRSALLAWICLLIFLIAPSERALGNASFLVLVACAIQPAEAPLAAVVEREFFTLLFVCIAWAWSNMGIAIAHAARTTKLSQTQTSIQRVLAGDYIEARSSIVCAVFLSIGSAVVLYIKVRFGPSPFLFATVLSCILMNICLTYAPLYPYAFYSLGQSVVVPLAVKAAVNIILSVIFFPKSVNSQFVERLIAVLDPIAAACGDQVKLLQTSPLDTAAPADKDAREGFDFDFVARKLAAAEGGLMPLSLSSRLLTREVSFGLANGDDLREFERLTRSLVAPADGWAYYYSSIKADIQSAHFPKTPVPSRLATPAITPAITPRTSLDHARNTSDSGHHATAHHVQLHPPSRPHSPGPAPAQHLSDTPHALLPASGTSTPHRESPLHAQLFPHDSNTDSAGASATAFRQLDEHPSVQPGNELSSSRFRKMARSIASASRSSSPRRWMHHGHNSPADARDHTPWHHHHHAWERSSHMLHNFVHRRDPAPVAIWESIRFGNLETYLHTAAANHVTEMFARLIRETSCELLATDAGAIRHITAWLAHLNSHRYAFLRDRLMLSASQRAEKGRQQAESTRRVIASVETALSDFRTSKRLAVLEPYKAALRAHDASGATDDAAAELDLRTGPGEIGKIHHRYLYQAWLHQFHTINFTERLLTLLRDVEHVQSERTAASLWFPHWPRIFSADVWRNASGDAHDDDEPSTDPEHIPDISSDTPLASRQRSRSTNTAVDEHVPPKAAHAHAHFGGTESDTATAEPIVDLGSTRRRDPDALDPEGLLQVVGHTIYMWVRRPFRGNALFGIKAAVLIALVSLPAYIKSSAPWCYSNRAIWAIFMAQLTLARFRGETAFALLSRILATVIGAVWALVIWYISTGSGRGNAYGLGATCAVAFPLLFLYRIYYPGPPITPIIASVTTVLIVGYSWKDVTNPTPGSPGYGWSTAWRRLVAVIVGVSAAYMFSYLPPSSTLREYQRLSHAATIAELGKIYCAVVGIASHGHHDHASRRLEGESVAEVPASEVVRKRIIGVRAKLRRLSMISVNVSYEFSLRGRWPSSRYAALFSVQMEISKLLSHCIAVLERLGPAYSIALLRRTRFLDPRFLGDVLSVISMCSTALKTAEPLPQVTPCPLVDRFMDTPHGFNAYLPDDVHTATDPLLAELPTKITLQTLEDAEYMTFAVGVATLFGLVVRIDRLCVAVKQLVGESYAVPVDVHRMLSTRKTQ